MPYLFQISIGPVQAFIQDARRTRDLAFNSSFLSGLARVAAQKITSQDRAASLIFPAGNFTDVPNKILAYIELLPSDLAKAVKQAINDRVQEYWNYVDKRIKQPFAREMAKLQIDDLVEFTWAAVPFDRATGSYWIARQRLDALLAARKNTRDFRQVALEPGGWGSDMPKSSINGQLESIIPKDAYPLSWNRVERAKDEEERERLKEEYRRKTETLRKQFGAGPHEKLSGVDLLKRLGPITLPDKPVVGEEGAGNESNGEKGFPSTSHMAALPFLQALYKIVQGRRELVETWKTQYIPTLLEVKKAIPFEPDILPQDFRGNSYWQDIFALDSYDGALLYPERFPDVVGDAQVYQEVRNQFQDAVRILDTFCQSIDLFPTPYFTLLAADGDSMGKVIDWQARAGMEQHQSLSQALSGFAGGVGETVQQHAGVCIYAGGDDVLALLPLHRAVECAGELAQSFRKALGTFQDEGGHSPTLSVGLAVVHHLHPLWDALKIARAAEQRAKSGGKDALAITVQKRGGPPCEVGGQWEAFDKRLEQQIKLCQSEIIPSGMAYELEEIALRLESEPEVSTAEREDRARPEIESQEKPEISLPHVRYAALRVFQRKLGEAERREKRQEQALTLYALKRMVGLIGTDGALETPDKAFKALQRTLGVKEEDTRVLEELKAQTSTFDQLQPVRVASLADELIVARLFASARRLADGKSEGGEA